ncbi:hypothetical protein MSAN_02318600 [Mycena sanguinolenta]|uniref:Uncharacterized protein n=1 Tax=Mycena sanguinolenta TaxID=230812 RepID=A0A8H6X7L7_9AGAR|nr:hypothetical protein MSAN_02318600 [Mycena sanguinolenta]
MKILAYICANEVVIIPEATFVRARTVTPNSLAFDGIATMLACHCVKGLGTDSSPSLSEPAAIVPPAPCPPGRVAALSPASTKSCPVPSVSSVPSHGSSSSSTPASGSSQSDSSASTSSESSFPASSSSSAESANVFFWGRWHALSIVALSDTVLSTGTPPDIVLPVVKRFFTRTLDGENEEDNAPSIDIPLDAHILPGTGRHTCAFLPFIYMADPDNVLDLATSIACQRYVWGISQPAVGFVLHNSRSVLELVISWVDPATHGVHIASPLTSKEDPTVGVFDFSNPTAALSLAKFVLGLSNDVATILTCATAGCENNRFDWRSDNLPSQDFGSCHERVHRWVHDVAICRDNSSRPSTPPSSSPSAAAMSSEDASQTRSKTRKAVTDPKGTAAVPSQANPTKQDQTSNPSAPGSKRSKTTTKTYANKSALGFVRPGGDILTWTFERCAYLCGIVKYDTAPENAEMKGKIESYHAMCGFQRPSWNRNQPPTVPEHLETFLKTLLDQVVERQSSPKLKPDHEAVVGARLPILLSASIGAFTQQQRGGKQAAPNVNEAESRHEWDALLYRFYVSADEDTSEFVLLERTIHFARNETAELLKDPKQISNVVAAQIKQAQQYYTHCVHAQLQESEDDAVNEQVSEAANHARLLLQTLRTLAKSEHEFQKTIDTHSRLEPRDGIADAMLFLAIPGKPELVEKAQFICYTATAEIKTSPETLAGPKTTETKTKPKASRKPSAATETNTSDSETSWKPSRNTKRLLHNPFSRRPEQVTSVENPVLPKVQAFKDHLILPHAPAEYKKPSDDFGKALNQGRMYLVSVVAFYSAIGIEDYPFYSVVTSGTLGAVIMAWKSPKNKVIYLMDRNVTTFNIAIPIEAFHFATFLLRLHDDRAVLIEKVKQCINKPGFDAKDLDRWRKSVQNPKTEETVNDQKDETQKNDERGEEESKEGVATQ